MRNLIILILFNFCISAFSQNTADSLCPLTPSLIPVKVGDKWGYLNRDLKLVIKPKFESADFFESIWYADEITTGDEHYATVKYKGNYHRIDSLGIIITTLDSLKIRESEFAMKWSEPEYYIVSVNNKYGVVDAESNKQIIAPIYDSIIAFDEHRVIKFPFLVMLNGKYGVVDYSGEILVPIIYNQIYNKWLRWYNIGLVYCELDNKRFYVDYCGVEYRIKL